MKLVKLFLLVVLFVMGCNGNAQETTEADTIEVQDSAENSALPTLEPSSTPEPTKIPTATSAPTAEPVAEVDTEALTLSQLNNDYSIYSSYTLDINMTVTSGETGAIAQYVDMLVQISNDPPMQQIVLTAQGVDEALGAEAMTIEMASVEGQTFMDVPEMGCIAMPTGSLGQTPFAALLQTDEILQGLDNAERVLPNEMVNGVEAKHYVFDESFYGEIEEGDVVQGDLWIEADSNRLVRLQMSGAGGGFAVALGDSAESDTLDPFTLVYDIVDVNVPFEVTIPTGCEAEAAGVENTFPILSDAYEQASIGAIVNYKTPTSLSDAVTFYQDAFAAEGYIYDEGESFVSDAVATLIFNIEGGSLTVLIAPDPLGDDTTVTIMDER